MFIKFFIIGLISLSVAGATLSNEIDIEKIKSQLPEGILPEGFNSSSIPSADEAKKLFKEKCYQVAGNDEAFLKAENATDALKDCLTELVDFEVLQKEIDAAQPNGELDTVFNKYCRKRSIAIECMKTFTVSIEPCLNEKEVANKKTFVNIFTNLLNFVCHKDGDQIALFIAEKGPECFNSKKDALIYCINSTMAAYVPSETPSLDNIPQLVMGPQQCEDMNTLQKCVVKELESCEESTPANLVESMFKFVRNETPCANMTVSALHQRQPGDGSANAGNLQTSLTILSTTLLAATAWIFL